MTSQNKDTIALSRRLCQCVQTLYPGGIAAGVFPVDVQDAPPPHPQELDAVATASRERRRHYLAGRRAAHVLLEQARAPSAPLLSETDGAITWPEGWTGSITHSADWCAAAIARRSDSRGIGIDLENSARMNEPIARRILTPAEQQWAAESEADDLLMAALLFSAKEALYKAAAPILKKFIGFRDAELRPERNAAGWVFHAQFIKPEFSAFLPPAVIHARGTFCGEWCLAGVWLAP